MCQQRCQPRCQQRSQPRCQPRCQQRCQQRCQPRCQQRCQPRCQLDASRDYRRDVISYSSIYNTVHCLSAIVMFGLPLRAPDVINGTLFVRRARADQHYSVVPRHVHPVISVINIGSSVPPSSSVPRRSGSYVMFVVRIR